MAQLIQIIDKRIAKFSTKGSPLKPIFSQKDTRNVKLKPIEILSAAKAKNDPGVIQTTQKVKRIKVQASDMTKAEDLNEEPNTIELLNESNVHEYSNHTSPLLEPTENSREEELKEIQVEKLENNDTYEEMTEFYEENNDKKFKFTQYEIEENWEKLKRVKKYKLCERYNWILYKVWRKVMRRGVRCFEKKWILRVKSVVLIQKNWKMFKARKSWYKIKSAVEVLQRFFKVSKPQRKYFLAVKTIAKLLKPLYRLQFLRKNKAAIKIQKVIKGRRVFKQYRPLIDQKLKIFKHKMMLNRQATLKKERNVKKTAAKVIEDHWMAYQERLKLKDVRKYLWTLPYECRLLYFKFQQVKKDADSLKNDVDQLIAKKQGKVSG